MAKDLNKGLIDGQRDRRRVETTSRRWASVEEGIGTDIQTNEVSLEGVLVRLAVTAPPTRSGFEPGVQPRFEDYENSMSGERE